MTEPPTPCPLCAAEILPEGDGYEHPASDTCPLDSLYIEARHVTAWNRRAERDQLRHAAFEASHPDFIWGAMDNVNDAETTLDVYAAAVSRAIRAALSSGEGE